MPDETPEELTSTVSHVVPVSLKQWIKDEAARLNISASEVVRRALEAARTAAEPPRQNGEAA